MASGTRGSNTMAEQLRGLLGQLAEMKAAPDADIAYLTSLETQVLRFLRQPFEKQRLESQLGSQGQNAGPNAGQPSPMGAQPVPRRPGAAEMLLLGAPPRATPPVAGGFMAGGMPGANMPAADELRRLMEQPAL